MICQPFIGEVYDNQCKDSKLYYFRVTLYNIYYIMCTWSLKSTFLHKPTLGKDNKNPGNKVEKYKLSSLGLRLCLKYKEIMFLTINDKAIVF